MAGEPEKSPPVPKNIGTLPPAIGDQPTADDKLNFSPYVDALLTFLLQANPPLTVSIEGKWGIGKSSFMMQLEDDLRDEGHFTVYFNPWRHESEEALWAAFMLTFIEQISRDLTFLDRWWGHIRLIKITALKQKRRTALHLGITLFFYVLSLSIIWTILTIFGAGVLERVLSVLGVTTVSGVAILVWIEV